MAIFPGSAIPSAVSDYEIDNSLRFNRPDSPYLARTFTAGNRQVFTISAWAKLGGVDEDDYGIGFNYRYRDE